MTCAAGRMISCKRQHISDACLYWISLKTNEMLALLLHIWPALGICSIDLLDSSQHGSSTASDAATCTLWYILDNDQLIYMISILCPCFILSRAGGCNGVTVWQRDKHWRKEIGHREGLIKVDLSVLYTYYILLRVLCYDESHLPRISANFRWLDVDASELMQLDKFPGQTRRGC
jgi:hypothetical protein